MVRFAVVAGLGAAAMAACNRTPPEPTGTTAAASIASEPPAPQTAQTPLAPPARSAAPSATPSRCIAKWPSQGPKIPPAATPPACPPDPEPNLKLATADLSFSDVKVGGSDLKIQVEVAKSQHEVERGLMYRRSMPDDHGMIFKLEGRSDHMFWMHNTCIPLDMMFVDDDGLIVGIVEGAEPLTESTRSVGCPSVFVVEVNGGFSRKHGVAPGQKIAIPSAAR
jgi:uncharacterized membrane protein (UPF0127 family)